MKKTKVGILTVGLALALTISGCSNDVKDEVELSDNEDIEVVVDKEDESKNEDNSNARRAYSDEEIAEMYGGDSIVYESIMDIVGKEIPNLQLLNSNNEEVSLYDEYKNEPYIIELMATWCPACKETLETAKEFTAAESIPLVFISPNEDVNELEAFIGDLDVPFYVGKDENLFFDQLNIPFVPAYIYVDSDNIVQMLSAGAADVELIKSIANRSFNIGE